jgi:aminoglycoside phosphotransferase (APT) family kinase protein
VALTSDQPEPTIVHAESRVDNALIDRADPRRIVEFVAWEMSTIGDRSTGVVMMCAYQRRAPAFMVGEQAASTSEGWPSLGTIAHEYAAASGRALPNFNQFRAITYFKPATNAEEIHSRYLAQAVSGPGLSTSGQAVDGRIAAGRSIMAPR